VATYTWVVWRPTSKEDLKEDSKEEEVMGQWGERKPPSRAGKKTYNERAADVDHGLDPDTGRREQLPASAEAAVPADRPKGYADDLLWEMATVFERMAYEERVATRSVPYVYKALAQAVDRSGMRTLTCWDGAGLPVRGVDLGVRLVRFFWNRYPWDRSGDVLSQFASPVAFDGHFRALRKRWHSKRTGRQMQERLATYTPEEFHRADRDKHPVGYKHLGG
jgi:hypothetical protein